MRHPLRSARARLHFRFCFLLPSLPHCPCSVHCALCCMAACVLCTACLRLCTAFRSCTVLGARALMQCGRCWLRALPLSLRGWGLARTTHCGVTCCRVHAAGIAYPHTAPTHCTHSVHNNCPPARCIQPLLTTCPNCAIMEAHSIECQHGAGT